MANLKDLTTRVQTSVDNLNEITGKIARGEGTVGKLVNSEEAHDQLMSALGSVEKGVDTLSDTLGRVQKLKLDLGMDGVYLEGLEDARTAFRADLRPQGDESPRFYRFEMVNDPRGRLYEKTETVTVTRPDGSTETTTTERVTPTPAAELLGPLRLPVRRAARDAVGRRHRADRRHAGRLRVLDRRLLFSFEAFDFRASATSIRTCG